MRCLPAVLVVLVVTFARCPHGHAAVLKAGPTRTHKTPCQAVAAAAAGDVIEVDPGLYQDDFCTLNKDNLTIRGVGSSRPHLQATVLIPNGKGIFVVPSGVGPTTVENLELSGAKVSDDNGAGIRMQGKQLTVRNCYFHDNQNGILSGGTADYEVLIERSEFAYNGNAGSGQEHNLYIGSGCKSFTFRYNYSHHAKSGHTLKSRANVNHILYNRIMDEADGFSSYVVDLPQGGRSYLIGNLIQQGPNAENHGTIVNYKCESPTNPELDLYAVNNTIVNDHSSTNTKFIRVCAAGKVSVINNLFVGPGTPVDFPNGSAGITYTNTSNLQTSSPGLVDKAAYNYRLAAGSPAIDKGTNPGTGGAFSLTPIEHYKHKADKEVRPAVGPLDIGAYEFGTPSVPDGGPQPEEGGVRPNDGRPAADLTRPPTDGPGAGDGPTVDRGAGADGGEGEGRGEDGCGCAVGAEPGALSLLLLVFGLLALLRGRRTWRKGQWVAR